MKPGLALAIISLHGLPLEDILSGGMNLPFLHIATTRRQDIGQKILWPTKNYLDNGPDKQHRSQVLPTKDSS